MISRSTLLAQAREWQVLLHSGRATAADREAAAAWRQAAPEHEAAVREVESLWALLGQVGERAADLEPDSQVVPLTRRSRRLRWAVPLATAASLALAAWLPQGLWVGLYADIHTAPGEVREVRLDDGSVLTLNGDTALDWSPHGDRREVRLYRGEADFQVAPDAGKPFFVEAGAARIRVTGTRFDVNLGDDKVLLAVTHGQVQAASASQPAVAVNAEQQVQWLAGQREAVQPLDARQRLAWQRGKLVFRSRALSDVFAELQRSQRARVVFLDQATRDLRVTGVFALDDPQAVMAAIEHNLPVRLVRLPGVVLVTSRDADPWLPTNGKK
ncbi:FecR family protein [Pseudomonas sp. LRF_L74]|uniref:FecR family protein n=1 Tax=Pseudomonas sp. LRF_L74 TaxID=3369422 RepID=UPI003F5FE197